MTAPPKAALADTAAVAVAIGRSPGYVRLLVHRGVLKPVDVERGRRGRPRLLFDLREVRAALQDTPYWVTGS